MKTLNIGDKYLKMANAEDVLSLVIVEINDVYEISPRENAYDVTVMKFSYSNDLAHSLN
jgi:hypothetical protein